METKAKYTSVGLFVVLLTGCLVVFFFWLSGHRHDQVFDTYLTYMSEEVTGLSVQSAVRYNGVPVGFVQSIGLDPDNPQLVQIKLQIAQGTPITTSTVASLNTQGITGISYVALKTTTPRAPMLVVLSGQKYPVIPSKPSFLLQLSYVLPRITDNIQKISDSFSRVLNEDNRKAIRKSLKNINQFTSVLAGSSGDLKQSMASLKTSLNNTAVASKDLPAMVDKLQSILTKVNRIAGNVSVASQSVVGSAKDTRVILQNFSQQVVPNITQVMSRMNRLMLQLNKLTMQLERNPSMFVRGRVPKAPGPGEK